MRISHLIAIGYFISYNIEYKLRPSIHKQITNHYFTCTNEISIVIRVFRFIKGKQYSGYSLFDY